MRVGHATKRGIYPFCILKFADPTGSRHDKSLPWSKGGGPSKMVEGLVSVKILNLFSGYWCQGLVARSLQHVYANPPVSLTAAGPLPRKGPKRHTFFIICYSLFILFFGSRPAVSAYDNLRYSRWVSSKRFGLPTSDKNREACSPHA